MDTKLDHYFDSHWAHIYKLQETTVNIILKVRINKTISKDLLLKSIRKIEKRIPYLTGQLENNSDNNFYLRKNENTRIKTLTKRISELEINTTMETLSPNLRKKLNLEAGELLNIYLYSSERESIIELVCSHLIGDATATLILLKEILSEIDGKEIENREAKRLKFEETSNEFTIKKEDLYTIPLPENPSKEKTWPRPDIEYKRFFMDKDKFHNIKSKLIKNKINGTNNDFFYYIAALLFSEKPEAKPIFSTVQSFRDKLKNQAKTNLNTSVAFKPIETDESLANNPKKWIEDFHKKRKSALEKKEILELAIFLRSLNISLEKSSREQGKELLFNLIPINAFAFNNIGKLDDYIDNYENFKVSDINYQDGTPGEFFRIYGFRERIYFSPLFYKNSIFKCDEFWGKFNDKMDEVLSKMKT